MAGDALEIRVLGPDLTRIAPNAAHPLAELNCLPHSKTFRNTPRISHRRVLPVWRHHSGERLNLKVEIGMPGCNHFVIHRLRAVAEMARKALLIAANRIARVIEPERDRFGVIRILRRMRTKPVRCGAMTTLAAHTVIAVECAGLLIVGNLERMATLAFGRRRGIDNVQVACDAFANISGQGGKRPRMLILNRPGGVFVLENGIVRARLH